jgi:hypothetical protein
MQKVAFSMEVEVQKQPVIKGAAAKLAVCGAATAAWLIAAFCIGYFAHPPMDDLSCKGTFTCLTASEWGDFLAGVFAPVAFLWLVVTVWIQSDELREQRVELALTRNEFELNRAVMQEEAEAARRQAEYLATQTAMLADQARVLKTEASAKSFFVLMSRYIEHSSEFSDKVRLQTGTAYDVRVFKVTSAGSDEKYVHEQNEYIARALQQIGGPIFMENATLFDQAFVFLYSAEELCDGLPFHSRVSWKRSRLESLLDTYCEIVMRCDELSGLRGHVSARESRLNAKETKDWASELDGLD